jgi:hypothetical protein
MVETMDEVLKIALAEPLTAIVAEPGAAEAPAIADDTITH